MGEWPRPPVTVGSRPRPGHPAQPGPRPRSPGSSSPAQPARTPSRAPAAFRWHSLRAAAPSSGREALRTERRASCDAEDARETSSAAPLRGDGGVARRQQEEGEAERAPGALPPGRARTARITERRPGRPRAGEARSGGDGPARRAADDGQGKARARGAPRLPPRHRAAGRPGGSGLPAGPRGGRRHVTSPGAFCLQRSVVAPAGAPGQRPAAEPGGGRGTSGAGRAPAARTAPEVAPPRARRKCPGAPREAEVHAGRRARWSLLTQGREGAAGPR